MNTTESYHQSLSAIVGHTNLVRTIRDRVADKRLPHALIFEGPNGIGKWRTALATASRLLCETPNSKGDACGQCRPCQKLIANSHADLHLVTPNEKNNIVLEAIRDIERAVRLRSLERGPKIVLIRGAHRMGVSSQNALLKTLEEPPDDTHMILVSSQPSSLLPTIRSRCQKLRFGPLTTALVEQVIKSQSPDLSSSQVKTLAHLSEGAPGEALAMDADKVEARIRQIKTLDRQFGLDKPESTQAVPEQAAALAKDRQELAQILDAWVVWSRDQLLLSVETSPERVAHIEHLPELKSLLSHRSQHEVLRRTHAILAARRQLDLPANLNPTMLTEQLFLSLLGLTAG